MMTFERPKLVAIVTAALAEYVKVPTATELDAWWGVCRVFNLADLERALRAHAMDPDDGKRAPRPVDMKRRLASPRRDPYEPGAAPSVSAEQEERLEAYRLACIRSPSVRATAHAIALRHGNKPWGPRGEGPFQIPRQREPGEDE